MNLADIIMMLDRQYLFVVFILVSIIMIMMTIYNIDSKKQNQHT